MGLARLVPVMTKIIVSALISKNVHSISTASRCCGLFAARARRIAITCATSCEGYNDCHSEDWINLAVIEHFPQQRYKLFLPDIHGFAGIIFSHQLIDALNR